MNAKSDDRYQKYAKNVILLDYAKKYGEEFMERIWSQIKNKIIFYILHINCIGDKCLSILSFSKRFHKNCLTNNIKDYNSQISNVLDGFSEFHHVNISFCIYLELCENIRKTKFLV